jgi:HEAT repeat protein
LAKIAGLGVAALVIAGALLWMLLMDPYARGPAIKGKPLAFWTRQLRAGQMNRDVIRALATERGVAVPALVKQLSLPDSAASDYAKRLWRRLPPTVQNKVPTPTTRGELRAGAAFALVMIYENDFLETAAPTLSEAQMMLPALTKALQDQNVNVRLNAAIALRSLAVISAQAIESCDAALKDPHWSVRANAVNALGRLGKSDERAIPSLKSALADSRPEIRKLAAIQLERLGIPPRRDDASGATSRNDPQ